MLLAALLALCPQEKPSLPAEFVGPWRAALASPGGELPFALELDASGAARVVNGAESIPVPDVKLEGGELVLAFPHYDSEVRARLTNGALDGAWTKRTAAEEPVRLAFHATKGASARFAPETSGGDGAPASVAGRYSVRFEKDARPAVGIFEGDGASVIGTFLTATGDYRYLAGSYDHGRLRLSCFDGAHAFLFDARATKDGLAGTFHSGATWKDAWTATRDDAAKLDDPWNLTTWTESVPLPLLVYPDLSGQVRSLGEWQSTSKAFVLVLFGSWCPNCHDELADLAELDRRLRPKGLSIVALAFEQKGEFEHDAQQARRAMLMHKASFPVLLGGRAAKGEAAEALPGLGGLAAFPTTLFFHRDGRIRAVHTGYSGPSTGAEHAKLLAEFEATAQELLDEPDADLRELWPRLASGRWVDLPFYFTTTIFRDDKGAKFLSDDPIWMPESPNDQVMREVRVQGPSVWFDARLYAYDAATSVFIDPFDAGHRLLAENPPGREPPSPIWTMLPEQIDENARSATPRLRREALYTSVRAVREGKRSTPLDPAPFLSDADPFVRCVAAWAAGELRLDACVPALVASASSPFGPLRREVAHAFRKLKRPETRATLETLARDPDPLVRQHAKVALDSLPR